MSKFKDLSSHTGVYSGDLRYGRCNNNVPVRGKDFSGEENKPVMPLILVTKREPELWKKDDKVKMAKKEMGSQHGINYVIESFFHSRLSEYATLSVGKTRF